MNYLQNIIINRGALIDQDKCLAINVPFTDEQQKQLIGKTRVERHEIVKKWREEYAISNGDEIIKDSLKLDVDLKELRKQYKIIVGKQIAPRYQNDAEYMQKAIDDVQKENLGDEKTEESVEKTDELTEKPDTIVEENENNDTENQSEENVSNETENAEIETKNIEENSESTEETEENTELSNSEE